MANFPVNITISAMDGISAKLEKVNKHFAGLQESSKKLSGQWEILSKSLNISGIQKSLGKIGNGFGQLKDGVQSSLTRLTLGVAAAGAGIFTFAKSSADYLDELAKTADRLGIGVESFQQLGYAAQLSGVKNEEFTKSLDTMSEKVGELKLKQGGLYELLQKQAPAFLEQIKNAKDNEEAFNLLITAVGSIKDPMQQAVLAQEAFGKSGKKLITLAKEGPEGIAKLRKEAAAYGIVSEGTVKKGEAFNDSLDRLTHVFNFLRTEGFAPLFPVLTNLTDRFSRFLVSILPHIKRFAKQLAKDLPGAIASLREEFDGLMQSAKPIFNFIKGLAEKFGALKVAVAAFGIFIGAPLIAPLATLASAFVSLGIALAPVALTMASLALPFLPIIAAIGGLAFATYQLVNNWSAIKTFFKDVWDGIANYFTMGIENIKVQLNKFIDLIPNYIKDKLNITKFKFGAEVDANAPALPAFDPNNPGAFINGLSQPLGEAKQISSGAVGQDVVTKKNQIEVKFSNLPEGTKVQTSGDSDKDLNLMINSGMQGMYGF